MSLRRSAAVVKLWGEGSGPPYGYQVIAPPEDLQPDPKNPEEKVPPAAVDLNEKQDLRQRLHGADAGSKSG